MKRKNFQHFTNRQSCKDHYNSSFVFYITYTLPEFEIISRLKFINCCLYAFYANSRQYGVCQ